MFSLPPEIIAAILSVIATAIGAAVVLIFNRRSRTFQLLESGSRVDLSLNINVLPNVFKVNDRTSILETRIEVTNNSRKTCCIPAVYVSARSLVRSGLEGDYLGESDFKNLPACEKLSEIRNVARMENTVIQLAPDETERFVRWDTLNESFVEHNPVVVVNVEVISVPSEFIGEGHFPKFKEGKYRKEWLRLMNEDEGSRHTYIILGRLRESEYSKDLPVKVGRRYLRLLDGKIDSPNTAKFRKLLDSMVQWSRHTTVNLLNAPPSKLLDASAKQGHS